jgi:hypothetical protein
MRPNWSQLANPKIAPWFWAALGLTAFMLIVSSAGSDDRR